MTSHAPTATGPEASTSRRRPVVTLTPSPAPIPPSPILPWHDAGDLCHPTGRRTFEGGAIRPTSLEKTHGTLAPFSIASVVGATGQIRSCCAASVRDPTLVGERHGAASAFKPTLRLCVTASGSGMPSPSRCPMFAPILRTVARPGPAADFDSEAKLTRCPYITNISGSARILQGSRGRGMSCFGCSLVERRRPVQGWGLFRAVFGPPPPGRLDDELHDEGCSIVPLRSPDPTSIMGPPGTRPPVSGPRIRNPEDSWRLACPGHSKRCRQKLRFDGSPPGQTTYKDNADPSAPRSDPRLCRLQQTNNPIRSFRLPGLKQCFSKHISASRPWR